MRQSLVILVTVSVIQCMGHQPAFQTPLSTEKICRDDICKFHLSVRDEMSMTEKIFGQGRSPVTKVGETFLVELDEDGKLHRGLGSYYNKPLYADMNGTDIEATDNVITTNGLRRKIITINGVFPGPTLEVMEGAEIEVTVTNQMIQQSITIHWHGFHMKETPWMDGVATITQCPISPGNSFVYRFKATPSGTLWYHAHLGGLRADGAFGLFIVHKNEPQIPHYNMIVQHWTKAPFDELMITNPYKKKLYGDIAGDGSNVMDHYVEDMWLDWKAVDGVPLTALRHGSALINGRGQYNGNNAPLSWFNVSMASEIGFYFINPGMEYTYNISIDHHSMDIVGLGIGEVEPISVDAVYLNPGERIHVKVKLKDNHKVIVQGEEYSVSPQNYWIRARTLNDEEDVKAVLHYDNAVGEPKTLPRICTEETPCKYYNCPHDDTHYSHRHVDCIASYTFNGGESARKMHSLVQKVDKEVFVDFGFPIGASVNGYRFANPKNHMYSDEAVIKDCGADECQDKPCYCTHILDLPFNKTIQMVLSNFVDLHRLHGKHHTIHLHGHDFVVLKTEYPDYNDTTGYMNGHNKDLECPDERMCRKMKWTNDKHLTLKPDNRPLTDTVLVPYGGYTVVRIHTSNPGYWLMHCHQMMHATEGMDVLVRVAPEKAPKPPPRFAMNCGNYEFTHEEFKKYMDGSHDQGDGSQQGGSEQGNGSGLHQCSSAVSKMVNNLIMIFLASVVML